ncbi:MAG: Cellobiose 2-epimerase [Chloroflexi bacterium ADurb.Bin325]|nr:MAG: Cellobiose 2-epimerase [Chloroflexi bacterium ADurb.Bin325]
MTDEPSENLMTPGRIDSLLVTYRDGLLDSTLPFWFPRCIDEEYGGFLFSRDRDGALLDTDKAIWLQGRAVWLLATLYAEAAPRLEWLRWARHGLDFLRQHGFDADGRMFFLVDRQGRPLRKRRYVFSEAFMIAGLAAYGRAAGDAAAVEQAFELYRRVQGYLDTPGVLPPKWDAQTRPMRGLATPMIMLVTAQILRRALGPASRSAEPDAERRAFCNAAIDRYVDEIRRYHMHPELAAVLETVGADGEFLDHFDGRTLNPGHAIEAAWFIMQEARERGNDAGLLQMGLTILDWMWPRGWDREHGGITYFVDVRGLPVQEYWHDMKFWWPQNEAIIATLMAYRLTGEARYARWHRMIHDWAYARFPDREHGEWFGYLHRDGRLSSTIKGNTYKGAFHVPRMELVCWQLMEELRRGDGPAQR